MAGIVHGKSNLDQLKRAREASRAAQTELWVAYMKDTTNAQVWAAFQGQVRVSRTLETAIIAEITKS
jgi:hypothetical protein